MGRHFIIVDDKHKEDGYRREEMRQRMNEQMGGYRMTYGHREGGYRDMSEKDYDEGYRTGYEHGYRDRDSRGRYM